VNWGYAQRTPPAAAALLPHFMHCPAGAAVLAALLLCLALRSKILLNCVKAAGKPFQDKLAAAG
jgi:hypothetical protein